MAKRTMKRKPPVRSPADSAAGRTNVLLEDQTSKFNLLADGQALLVAVYGRMETRLQKVEETLLVLPAIDAAIRLHTHELRGHGEQLRGHGEQLRGHGEQLRGHGEQLREHGEQLREHGEQLRGHGEQLRGHGEQLRGHGEQLRGHGEQLREHGEQLRELKGIALGIQETVAEVNRKLDNKADKSIEERVAALERKVG